MSDPYLVPETFVLKNKFGASGHEQLQDSEGRATMARAVELLEIERKLQISMQGWKAIHKLLFRDVYDWAGEYRTIYIAKENARGITRFLPHERIAVEGEKTMRHLKTVLRYANSAPINKLMAGLADVYLELNHIHPFREGNGRSQKLFFRNVLRPHGLNLDWSKVSKNDHIEAAVAGGLGDPSLMREHFNFIGSRHNGCLLTSTKLMR